MVSFDRAVLSSQVGLDDLVGIQRVVVTVGQPAEAITDLAEPGRFVLPVYLFDIFDGVEGKVDIKLQREALLTHVLSAHRRSILKKQISLAACIGHTSYLKVAIALLLVRVVVLSHNLQILEVILSFKGLDIIALLVIDSCLLHPIVWGREIGEVLRVRLAVQTPQNLTLNGHGRHQAFHLAHILTLGEFVFVLLGAAVGFVLLLASRSGQLILRVGTALIWSFIGAAVGDDSEVELRNHNLLAFVFEVLNVFVAWLIKELFYSEIFTFAVYVAVRSLLAGLLR
jgi:hypothetical protein